MTVLESRRYESAQAFVEDFINTLTLGIIPRRNFIQWDSIEAKIKRYMDIIEFFSKIKSLIKYREEFKREFVNSLIKCSDPYAYIQFCFEALGHTDKEFVSEVDDININRISELIKEGNKEVSYSFVELIIELGIEKILLRDNIEDVFWGVQIGLETHKRKNIGGKYFKIEVKNVISSIIDEINQQFENKLFLGEEIDIPYGGRLSKRCDFAIVYNEKVRFGIEVNFYIVSGSKPAEIKRSYGSIRDGLSEQGVDLIWITDGKGYRQMKRSLHDAYLILPNIYNLYHVNKYLYVDLINALK